jgi:hypothetical protein
MNNVKKTLAKIGLGVAAFAGSVFYSPSVEAQNRVYVGSLDDRVTVGQVVGE